MTPLKKEVDKEKTAIVRNNCRGSVEEKPGKKKKKLGKEKKTTTTTKKKVGRK